MSKLDLDEAILAFKSTRQFILKSFIEEGIQDKLIFSANHEEVDQLALVIKMVKEGLGWAWLPKLLNESEYRVNDIEPMFVNELRGMMKFPISLWCSHSKQIAKVKLSIVLATNRYVERVQKLNSSSSG